MLRQRAKFYKKEFLTLIYNERNKEETFARLKKIYEHGRTWVYWANVGRQGSSGDWVKRILVELEKLGGGSQSGQSVRMFLVVAGMDKIG